VGKGFGEFACLGDYVAKELVVVLGNDGTIGVDVCHDIPVDVIGRDVDSFIFNDSE